MPPLTTTRLSHRSTPARSAVLLIAALLAGCRTTPSADQQTQPSPALGRPSIRSAAIPPQDQPQPYDFYLLNLSWSPEFCATHADSPECAQHLGFVVHGLWPQRNDGSYPEHCGDRPGPTSSSAWQGLMPTEGLALHEWQTHGTCTPYDASTYFAMIRKAAGELHIPPQFNTAGTQTMEAPDAILSAFAQANPNFPQGSLALSCGHNYLTAIEACFDKNLNPIACQSVRTCHANNVKITPR